MTGQIDPETGLTARRALFAQAYVANRGNGTQAAIAAGYAESNAAPEAVRLLKIDKVRQYIDELSRDSLAAAKITPEYVLAQLQENLARAIELEKPGDVSKVLDLMGKHLAMWTEKTVSEQHHSFADPGDMFLKATDDPDDYPAA